MRLVVNPFLTIVDESYVITIDDNGSFIQGKTIYGIKHGLETLSQIIKFNRSTRRFEVPNFVKIMDAPRFKWRGLLLDTSRHYIKKENILSTLRGMEAVKMNVLHWHIIDAESFPLELESHPLLSEKGAYDQDAVYNATTIQEVIEAAKKSGIRVVFELDVPGHAASWGKGYPNITVECSKYSRNINNIPLDPTESFTYDVLDKVFTEISEMSDDEYIHTGGDEVVFGCFTNNTKILKYMADNGIKDAKKLAHLFEGKLDTIFERLGRKKIIWQDMYGYGAHVDPRNTIVHFWNDKSVLREVLSKNIRSIISTGFYLNNLLKWEDYYSYEPIPSGLNPRERELIIGGEACVWAEKISSEVLDSVVWPRAAAVAERLWSNESVRDTNNMATRIKEGLTCHLG